MYKYSMIIVICMILSAIGYKLFIATTPTFLYKVLSNENWELSKQQKFLTLDMSMDKNFIHLAREDQLERIINKFWKNAETFVILKVATKKMEGKLVFEANPGGSNKYYHLYNGRIPLDAIADIETIKRKSTN